MEQRSVFIVAIVLLLTSSIVFGQDNRRTEKFNYPVTETGVLVGQCGNFDVLTDFTALASGTILYDKSGAVVQTIQQYRLIGESIYYNSGNPSKSVLGGPAEHGLNKYDESAGTLTIAGPIYRIRVPGYGLILAETGRLIVDLTTGQIVFNSGQNQVFEPDLTALCDYLK